MEEKAIKGLAYRGADLWLNLELSKFKPGDDQYDKVMNFLKQRFKTDELNPLLLTLGLLEMALIEDAMKGREYFSEEEREQVIQEIINNLAESYPEIVKEMEKILDNLGSKIEEFKTLAQKYTRAGGE